MLEENQEAKEEVVEKSLDEKQDEILDNFEKETQESTSDSKETTGKETSEKETTGSDQKKTEETKLEEEEDPKEFHKHPAWIRRREKEKAANERADAAESKLAESEQKGTLSDDDKQLLDDAKTITSSREGIETLMKAKGFTQDAIDNRLKDEGYGISEPGGDVSLVCKELNLDEKGLTSTQREDIEDFSKIARIVAKDLIEKIVSSKLAPVEEHINETSRNKSAETVTNTMKSTVEKDGILNFEKDVEPELHKYLDSNPKATQEDVLREFKDVNHRLTVERL
jgi:hypothetical protein